MVLAYWNNGIDEFQSMYNYLSLHKTIQHVRDKIVIKQKTGNLKFDNIRDLARIKAYKIKNLERGCMLSLPKTLLCSWMTVVSKRLSTLPSFHVCLWRGCRSRRTSPSFLYKNAGRYFRHAEKNLIFSQT